MNRYIEGIVEELSFDQGKIALISGPRQVGKTYLSKRLLKERGLGSYHNWDDDRFRVQWTRAAGSLVETLSFHGDDKPLLVLDEIHKDKIWKKRLKGLYDTLSRPVDLLVTGSARLNVFRKRSDSLFGRQFHFHLHPLSAGEVLREKIASSESFWDSIQPDNLSLSKAADQLLNKMMHSGTFPEPFYKDHSRFLNVWRRSRSQQVLREDLRDLSAIEDIGKIELMVALIAERVGSLAGRSSLRESLQVSFDSIRRWLNLLEEVYFVFSIPSYHKSLARALTRERKVYLWEIGSIRGQGARFENLVALHLLKACHFWSDSGEGEFSLHFLRTKDKAEIDFLICKDGIPWLPIEVKLDDTTPSPHWRFFMPRLNCPLALQITLQAGVKKVYREDKQALVVISAGAVLGHL